jgi:hypothetical protein
VGATKPTRIDRGPAAESFELPRFLFVGSVDTAHACQAIAGERASSCCCGVANSPTHAHTAASAR